MPKIIYFYGAIFSAGRSRRGFLPEWSFAAPDRRSAVWCDVGLTPSQNVVWEIYEESGFEAKVVKLLAVYDRDNQGHTPAYPFSIYKLFFHCEITGGSATTSSETSAVEFFAEDATPSLSLSLGRTLPGQIQRFFEYYRNPALPTDFD